MPARDFKRQAVGAIPVSFKQFSFFKRFDWYNICSHGQDVKWRIHITV